MDKNLILWLIIAGVLLMVFQTFSPQPQQDSLTYSDFIDELRSGRIQHVQIDQMEIAGRRADGTRFTTIRPPNLPDLTLLQDLEAQNVRYEGVEMKEASLWQQLLVASFPILLIIAVFMFFMRQMQGGAGGRGGPMSFGKSKARLLGEDQIKTTFADVAGVD